MNLEAIISRTYLDQALRTQGGRIHLLNQVAEAEGSSEGDVFERLLAQVDDPELARLVRRHHADELRHASLFRERVVAAGGVPGPVPEDLRMIDRLDRALDNFMQAPIVDRFGVMRAYLLLQVIEERAVVQFPLFADAFRRAGDTATAEVFDAVLKDEMRHLLYCKAISRRYAPDPHTLEALLAHYRAVEARAFSENTRANLRYMVERGYVDAGWLGQKAWLGFAALSERLGVTRPPAYSRLAAAAA